MLSYLSQLVATFFLGLATLFGAQTHTLGAAVPVTPALFETSLASPITSTATSMTLTDGTLTDGTTLSGYMCFTVDSGNPNAEYICGTAAGTAVSSLTRGVSPLTGTTTASSLEYSHRRGADVKITDYPTIGILSNIIRGVDTIPSLLNYANTVLIGPSSASTTVATKYYVDSVTAAGAAAGSNTVAGIYLSATGLQAASSTASGTYSGNTYLYALPASIATDTPNTATRGSRVLMSDITGYLKQGWLDLTQAFTFSGHLTSSATTTIAASGVSSAPIILNGIDYAFPPSQSASSTILSTNGSGQLYWTNAPAASYVGTTISTSTTNTGAGTWYSDYSYTTTFEPTTIALHISGTTHQNATTYYLYGTDYYTGTTCTNGDFTQGNTTGSTIAVVFGCITQSGTGSYDGERYTVTIPTVTSTGFTVRVTRTIEGTGTGGATEKIIPIAYR